MRMPRTLRFAVAASPLGSVAAWAAADAKPGAMTPHRIGSTAHTAAEQPLSAAARLADAVAFAKSPDQSTEIGTSPTMRCTKRTPRRRTGNRVRQTVRVRAIQLTKE